MASDCSPAQDGPEVLHPGRWTTVHFDDDGKSNEPGADGSLYVLGWFLYYDNFGDTKATSAPHRMTYCRRYDSSENRFVCVSNPDYEHEAQPN
jgi:hypothetical protein